MTQAVNQSLLEFEKDFQLVGPAFECGVISFFAVKSAEKWLLVRAQVRLLSTAVSTFSPVRLETSDFIAGASLIKKSDIEQTILSILRNGVLSTDELVFNLHGQPENFIFDFRGLRSALNNNWPRTFTLRVFDNAPFDLFSLGDGRPNIDFVLRSLPEPYDGLEDLFISLSLNLDGADNQARIVIFGDTPIMLDRDTSKLSSEELHLEVKLASGIDHKEVRVGYRLIPDAPTSRTSIMGTALTWTDDESLSRGKIDIPMKDVTAAHVFVSYRDQAFDKWWVANPDRHLNFRVATYEPFDVGRAVLRDALGESADRKAGDLENGIGILLSLCGFSVAQMGQISRLREGPDLIAVTPRGEVLIVEVTTTGVLDTKDKLSKLVSRSQQLKQHLAKSGWGHLPVQPVIVTSSPRKQLSDLDKAKANGIAVAALEDTVALFERLVVPQDVSEVFRAIGQLVPT